MKQIIQTIKNGIAKMKLNYYKKSDGLYLFFAKDNSVDINEVWLTSAIMQCPALKKKNSKGEYITVKMQYMEEHETTKFKFKPDADYVIYIPRANRITKITLDYTTVTNPLSDFARITSLTYLSIIGTKIHGNVNELKKLPFLGQLYLSDTYIKGITNTIFNNWNHLIVHEVI